MDFHDFKSRYEITPVIEFPHKINNDVQVSVCVQAYNHEKFIRECLESILSQKTDFPFEVLISEDHSKDKTREICLEFAEKYPTRIRLFLHSRANNIKVLKIPTGNFTSLYNFFKAEGKYIALCEGDDLWCDDFKLQKQFDFMESNPQYSVCYHNYRILKSDGQILELSPEANPLKADLTKKVLVNSFVHPAPLTIFFKNILHKDIPKEIVDVTAMDVFLCSLLGQIGPGKFLEEIKPSLYRIHNGGLWSAMAIEPKLFSKINTYRQLSHYYTRLGSNEIAAIFERKIRKIKLYLIFIKIKKFRWNNFFRIFKS